jgi:hypothetical protein
MTNRMTKKLFIIFVAFLLLFQFISCFPSNEGDEGEACFEPGPVIQDGRNTHTLSVGTQEVTLACKSCHKEDCPNWKFALKKTPEQIERLKSICKGKKECHCSDVALALMTEESTQEQGNTLMEGVQEMYKPHSGSTLTPGKIHCRR